MQRIYPLSLLLTLLGSLLASPILEAREYSALVVEPESGRVLYEKYANELRHPASVTKMMTLYLVFEALERGDITLNTPFDVSRNACLRPPSRLGMSPGDSLAVEDAILALVTRSANDAATVIAENLGGSEAEFAQMMTAKARALGMQDTVFRNASGLPDPKQVTTAWDMYRLGKALLTDFPRYYPYFSTPRFFYRGQSFDNHNHLMETYPGMDGIKTGFINSSGFNLVASAKQGGKRLIGVVFGGPSAVARDDHMREILDDGFGQLAGLPPREVEAAFEASPGSKAGSRFDDRDDLDPPQVTFGSPSRFKSRPYDLNDEPVNRAPKPYRAPVVISNKPAPARYRAEPAEVPRSHPVTRHPASAEIHHSAPPARTMAKPPATHAAPSTNKARTESAKADRHASSPHSAQAEAAHAPVHKSTSPAVCKGGHDKAGKCLAK